MKIDELIEELEKVKEEHGNQEIKPTVEPRIHLQKDSENLYI